MITDHKITIDDMSIYYRTAGDPVKQHLVFLHGWGARSSGPFGSDKVILELVKYFYIVAPEHPGLIRSTPPKEVWGFDEFAHLLRKLIQPLNLKHPIVMGQSLSMSLGVPIKLIDKSNVKNYSVMHKIPFAKGYELNVDYKELKPPLILVWGSKDTWITPIERAKEIHQEVKNSRLLIFNGSHVVLYRKTADVVAQIVNSLKKILSE